MVLFRPIVVLTGMGTMPVKDGTHLVTGQGRDRACLSLDVHGMRLVQVGRVQQRTNVGMIGQDRPTVHHRKPH